MIAPSTNPAIIGAGITFHGNVHVNPGMDLMVHGRVLGTLVCEGTVTVASGGELIGDLQIKKLHVSGTVKSPDPRMPMRSLNTASGDGDRSGAATYSRSDGTSDTNASAGTIDVSESLVIHDGGFVAAGEIRYGNLEVHPGGRLAGLLVPSQNEVARAPVQSNPTAFAPSAARVTSDAATSNGGAATAGGRNQSPAAVEASSAARARQTALALEAQTGRARQAEASDIAVRPLGQSTDGTRSVDAKQGRSVPVLHSVVVPGQGELPVSLAAPDGSLQSLLGLERGTPTLQPYDGVVPQRRSS